MKGLQIVEVKLDAQGMALSLQKGDIITEVNGASVSTNSGFSTKIGKLKASNLHEADLVLMRRDETLTVKFNPSEPLGVSLYPYKQNEGDVENPSAISASTPFAATLLTLFAYGALIIGVFMSFYFYPSGYRVPAVGYIISIASFVIGTLNFALLYGAAKVVEYLHQIELNTRKA